MPTDLSQFANLISARPMPERQSPTQVNDSVAPSTILPQSQLMPPVAQSPYPATGPVGWGMQGSMGGNNLPNSPWSMSGSNPNQSNSNRSVGMFSQPASLTAPSQSPQRSARTSTAATSRTSFGSPVPNVQRSPSPFSDQSKSYAMGRRRRQTGDDPSPSVEY